MLLCGTFFGETLLYNAWRQVLGQTGVGALALRLNHILVEHIRTLLPSLRAHLEEAAVRLTCINRGSACCCCVHHHMAGLLAWGALHLMQLTPARLASCLGAAQQGAEGVWRHAARLDFSRQVTANFANTSNVLVVSSCRVLQRHTPLRLGLLRITGERCCCSCWTVMPPAMQKCSMGDPRYKVVRMHCISE